MRNTGRHVYSTVSYVDLSWMPFAKFSVVCLVLFYYIPTSSSLPWFMCVLWTSGNPDMSSQSQCPNSHNFQQLFYPKKHHHFCELCGHIKTVRWISAPHSTEMKLVANTNFHVSHTCNAVDRHGTRMIESLMMWLDCILKPVASRYRLAFN